MEPTCTEAGYTEKVCSVCGKEEREEIPAKGHSYTTTVHEPTCTEAGYTEYTCDVCGYSYTGDETPAKGHSYTMTVHEATCTEGGYTEYTCDVCGYSYTGDETPATGHSYTMTVHEATCTEAGYIEKICSVCGDTEIEKLPAKGHNYFQAVKDPSCTEGGYTIHICQDCGYSYIEHETAALGHTVVIKPGIAPTCGSIGWTEEKSCSVCGEVIEPSKPIAMLDHEFTTSQVLVVPTLTESGSADLICKNDPAHVKEVVLPAIEDGEYDLINGIYEITIENVKISFEANIIADNADDLLEIMGTAGATAVLGEDLSLSSAELNSVLALASVSEYEIDLNGHTLTLNGVNNSVLIESGKSLSIRNGSLITENATYTSANFNIQTGASIILDEVNITSTGSVLFPQGDAAKVVVTNSTIKTSGVYIIGTNASTTDNYNVEILVENSRLETTAADGDAAAVMVNVESTLTMEDVEIIAQRQGIIVRAGTATLKDVTVDANLEYLDWANNMHNPSAWGSGDEVAYGALVIGNENKNAYKADAIVNIIGGSYTCVTSDDRLSGVTAALYAYRGTDYKTEITVSDATFNGYIVNYGNTAVLNGINDEQVISALLVSANDWLMLDKITATPNEEYYFLQVADLTVTKPLAKLSGTYDGNGYKLARNFSEGSVAAIFNKLNAHTTIKNVNLWMGATTPTCLVWEADWGTSYGVTFENITTNAETDLIQVNQTNFGLFIVEAIYTDGIETHYVFKNCVNNVNIQNVGTCTSVFIGSGPCGENLIFDYINCVNNGNVTGNSQVGYFYGNSAYVSYCTNLTFNVENCENNGLISSANDNAVVAAAPNYSNEVPNSVLTGSGAFLAGNAIKDLTFQINQNGTSFSINTQETKYSYQLVLSVNAIYWTMDGSAWTEEHTADIPDRNLSDVSNGRKYLLSLAIDASATGDLTNFKAYDVRTAVNEGIISDASGLTFNADGYALVNDGTTTYMIMNLTENYYVNSDVAVLLYAYEGDVLVGVRTVK